MSEEPGEASRHRRRMWLCPGTPGDSQDTEHHCNHLSRPGTRPWGAWGVLQCKSLATTEEVFSLGYLSAADALYGIAFLHREQGRHGPEAVRFDKCVVIYAAVYGDARNETAGAQEQAACAHAAMPVVPN